MKKLVFLGPLILVLMAPQVFAKDIEVQPILSEPWKDNYIRGDFKNTYTQMLNSQIRQIAAKQMLSSKEYLESIETNSARQKELKMMLNSLNDRFGYPNLNPSSDSRIQVVKDNESIVGIKLEDGVHQFCLHCVGAKGELEYRILYEDGKACSHEKYLSDQLVRGNLKSHRKLEIEILQANRRDRHNCGAKNSTPARNQSTSGS